MKISAPKTHPIGSARTSPELAALARDLSTDRLARGTRDNLAGILLERVFGLALLIALPLLLAPSALGQYYEAMALLTLTTILAMLGLDVGLVRFIALSAEAGRFGQVRAHVRTAVALGGGGALLLAAGLWAIAPILARGLEAPDLAGALRWGAIGVPFLTLAYLLVAPSKGLKRMRDQVVVIQVVHPAVHMAAAIAMVAAGQALAGAVGAFAVGAGAAFATAAALFFRLRLPEREARPRGASGALVRFSLPVSGMAVLDMALLWIDTLLLGVFRPPAEVAVYGLVARLMTVALAVLFTVIQIFGPFVTQLLARGDRDRLEVVLRTATRWTVLLAGPVLVLFALEGGNVLTLLHQHSSAGGRAAAIVAAAFLIDALTGPVGHVLTMSGRSGLNFANAAAALAANVGLNLVLIPRWGMTGAALSWAVVVVAVNLARMAEVRAIFRISPLSRSLSRPLIGLALAGGLTLVARWLFHGLPDGMVSLVFDAVLFCSVYIWIVALARNQEDRLLFRTLLRGRASKAVVRPVP